MTARDHEIEREFLKRAERAAGNPLDGASARYVGERLDAGDRTHGTAFAGRPVADLLVEVAEELADVAGWSALALTVLHASDMPEADRARVAAALDALAALGAQGFATASRAIASAEAGERS